MTTDIERRNHAGATTPRTRPRSGGVRFGQFAERYALLGLVVAVAVFFSVFPPSSGAFPTAANVAVITGNQSVIAALAIAAVIPLVCGYFDFSLGATAAGSALLCAGMMAKSGLPLVAAIAVAMVFAVLVGVVNGVLVARFRVNPFIATLGMSTLLGGLITWYSGGQTISTGVSRDLVNFGSLQLLGLPRVVYVVVAIAVLVWFLLGHTPYGRSLYAIGSNPAAARLVGIRSERNVFVAFVVAATIAGIAGILLTARQGGATADTGTGLLFPALAAVFLGATAFQPGRFNVMGTVVGVLFVSMSVSGLTLSGASAWVDPVFNGLALLVAVGLSTYFGRTRAAGDAR